ncbi:MAG TPA: protein phosphatase 2C domain-containing protein [Acetivibrio clariflavus]|nr:protein phosphatase 2C domain-containing protein [Acetivibrio clariflavus]
METKLKIDASVLTSKGNVRDKNEDSFYFNGTFKEKNSIIDPLSLSLNSSDKKYIFAVCDGMGGEQLGEEASHLAILSLHEFYISYFQLFNTIADLKKYMDSYISQTNQKIYEHSLTLSKKMGTTIAAILFCRDKAIAFNIGDSSVYLLRNSNLIKLTTEHTEAQRLVRLGVLNSYTAKFHKSKNILTRYLGANPANGTMEADYSDELTVLKGDTYLICSDGLSGSLTDEELKFHLSVGNSSASICKDLVDLALGNGGKDNVTALVVKIIDVA